MIEDGVVDDYDDVDDDDDYDYDYDYDDDNDDHLSIGRDDEEEQG